MAIYSVTLMVAAVALLVIGVPVHTSKLANNVNSVKDVKNRMTIE